MLRVFLLVFLFFSTLLKAYEDISLQLKWRHSFQFAGFYMAKEKGFYENEGLNLRIKELNQNIDVVADILNRKSTYGISDSLLVYSCMKNFPVRLIMPILDKTPLAIVSTDLSVKSLKDIEKKQIVLDRMVMKNPALIAMFKSNKIDIEKLKIADRIYSYEDLGRKIKIFAVYKSDELYYLRKKGIKYRLFEPESYGFDFYGDILFTSQYELENHPKRVEKFKRATIKGWRYAFSHLDETIKVIQRKYNTQNMTYEKLKDEAVKLKKYMSRDFKFCKNRLDRIQDIYLLSNQIDKSIDISTFIAPDVCLSKKEKEFIENHILKCISTTTWEPFNLKKENGGIGGIGIDFWEIIKKKTGIKSSCEVTDRWEDVLNKIESGKADLTLATSDMFRDKNFVVFSKPYASFKIAIVTRNDKGFVPDIKLLANRKIAVGKEYSVYKMLKERYPDLKFYEVKNSYEALRAVSDEEAYAMVDIFPVCAYAINKYKHVNLKIAGEIPIDFDVRIMLRKEYKVLLPVINEAIDLIIQEQKDEIYRKYLSVNYQQGYTRGYLFGVVFSALVLVLVLFGWAVYLKKEINKRILLEEELEKLATIDKLTSVLNRHKIDISLDEQVKISKRYGRKFSVIFFDIDHFKNINDTYGHRVGDIALKELTNVVSKLIRESDIFGRWGGEEFLIILPETNLDEAVKLAEKIRVSIEKHVFKIVKHFTCSFGVSEFRDGDDAQSLVSRVDNNMYDAKKAGRNTVKFS